MNDSKPWWQSRTIWIGLIQSIWGALAAAGLLPVWLDATTLVDVGIGILGVATIAARAVASKRVTTTSEVQ